MTKEIKPEKIARGERPEPAPNLSERANAFRDEFIALVDKYGHTSEEGGIGYYLIGIDAKPGGEAVGDKDAIMAQGDQMFSMQNITHAGISFALAQLAMQIPEMYTAIMMAHKHLLLASPMGKELLSVMSGILSSMSSDDDDEDIVPEEVH